MKRLRWKTEGRFHRAYSGEVQIGFVILRDDGTASWQIDAVRTRFIAKGQGKAQSVRGAKEALSRAWAKWLRCAALEAV